MLFSYQNIKTELKKYFYSEDIALVKVTCMFFVFSKFVMMSQGNHGESKF